MSFLTHAHIHFILNSSETSKGIRLNSDPKYRAERKKERCGESSDYIKNDNEREAYKLTCDANGLFHQQDGSLANGQYLFIHDLNGVIYGSNIKSEKHVD